MFNTTLIMEWATKENKIEQPDKETKDKWNEAAKTKMLDDFLELTFGYDSKLLKAKFISKCCEKELAYLFDSALLRAKTREIALADD